MKAAVLYGNEDLRYDDYPTPETKPGTVKIRVRASGICGSDIPRVLHNGAHFSPLYWVTNFPAMWLRSARV